MKQCIKAPLTAAAMAVGLGQMAHAGEVEVLHWWTSGGEAAALNVLKDNLAGQGISWVDAPVAGGGGSAAMTALRARATAGNPPTAAQMLGFDLVEMAENIPSLPNLNAAAANEGWDNVVPEALQAFAKFNGNWISAPVNVHSTNWVWANKKMLDDLGIEQPKTWPEFIAALDAVKASGKTALAHGGQPWQDATIFDGVVLSTGGVNFYRKAFIELDPEALGSDLMKQAFDRMAQLRDYVDDNFSGRDWNLASAMVINDEAAFQIMGDWAKGEFLKAGKTPNEDFLCFRVPGSQGTVSFNSDQFMMFAVTDPEAKEAQLAMASAVMSPEFQSAFNVVKGSVPARTDVPNDAFDACGKKGMAQLASAGVSGNLVGSMAHGHAARAAVKGAIVDVVTAHFNGEFDSATAVEELVDAVAAAQ